MNPSWRQLNIRFEDWTTVERTAAPRLAAAITQVEDGLAAWFFMRKADRQRGMASGPRPCWRVRVLPREEAAAPIVLGVLREHFPAATPVIYEPETYAFGGEAGMDVAHTLFHQDSRHVLTYLNNAAHAGVGRRELAMLLCSRLFRAAGQDWYEQGDIWARIAQDRRPADELSEVEVRSLHPALRRLMTVDTAQLSRDPDSKLAFAADWLDAYDDAGARLAQLAREGHLQRGLRGVLAHHALFGFNRLGLPSNAQTVLVHAASTLVFD